MAGGVVCLRSDRQPIQSPTMEIKSQPTSVYVASTLNVKTGISAERQNNKKRALLRATVR